MAAKYNKQGNCWPASGSNLYSTAVKPESPTCLLSTQQNSHKKTVVELRPKLSIGFARQ